MNSDVDELAQAVLNKPLHECSLDELQQVADQYPYFGPIQFLLAKKITESSSIAEDNQAQYEEQVQKASLYFQNRVWLDHLLNNDRNESYAEIQSTFVAKAPEREEKVESQKFQESETEDNNISSEPNSELITQPDPVNQPVSIQEPNHPTQMEPLQTDPPPTDAGLLFEPFHTVDYFASQGIKFKEEEKPKDRFGMQLKSFTEWLKTLKHTSAAEIATHADSSAEKKVEQMAEFSLAERHVITEAMAEVWIKQGNRAKAEEIYRKLSLLEPSKSSYFAAKIEELKKTN